jgi:hypothetical protein
MLKISRECNKKPRNFDFSQKKKSLLEEAKVDIDEETLVFATCLRQTRTNTVNQPDATLVFRFCKEIEFTIVC